MPVTYINSDTATGCSYTTLLDSHPSGGALVQHWRRPLVCVSPTRGEASLKARRPPLPTR